MRDPLDISHEIGTALSRGEPVVALESSLIAHGLPRGLNARTAIEMEDEVRSAGAAPATIGIIEGKIRVGLSHEEIERLAGGEAAKAAPRDIPYILAGKMDAGTTVSATVRIAFLAGISVVATGGIGGVHRGFAETNDISADLWELARTPVVVVCSGVKAVLDVPATLEWLETHGVPVYGYQTDEFPAFYSRSSGLRVPKLESPKDVEEVLRLAVGSPGVQSAAVIAAPVPDESAVDVSSEISQAAREAAEEGIRGKELTPYLLGRVGELTSGRSVEANVALLKNNARVAGEIACALSEASGRRVGFLS